MFDTFDFMAFNWCCILGGPYYPTYLIRLIHRYVSSKRVIDIFHFQGLACLVHIAFTMQGGGYISI